MSSFVRVGLCYIFMSLCSASAQAALATARTHALFGRTRSSCIQHWAPTVSKLETVF